MPGGKADDHGPGKVPDEIGRHGPGGGFPARLVASRQLAEHDGRCAGEDTAQAELREHPIDSVRALADLIEKQDEAVGRRERERSSERADEL